MKSKNSLTGLILGKLGEAGELALEALLPRNRTEAKLWRNILGLPTGYEFSPPSFSATLSRLKRQGLVSRKKWSRSSVWSLTSHGQGRLKFQAEKIEPPEPDGIPRLVVYDIPETDKHKREWVRRELVSYGFKQLQKSVWVGFSPLPEDFTRSLRDRRLNGNVQIIGITKTGTLEV